MYNRALGVLAMILVLSFAFLSLAQEAPGRQDRALFPHGCPAPGKALAREITDNRTGMWGPDALGRQGDWLIANNEAAFIIQGVKQINTYYYYGGILIDAARVENCAQANPEQFEELGLFAGELIKPRLASTGVRAFRGQSVEIWKDGSDGGPAVIRVHGTDDIFWIVEFTLMSAYYQSTGKGKGYTAPLGVDMYVDYVLEPDSQVLRIEYNIKNREDRKKSIITGAGGFFGDATQNFYYTDETLRIYGYAFDVRLPWLVSSSGQGAWAFAMKDASMASANLSGFDAFLDVRQFGKPIHLSPKGKPGDTAQIVYFMAVGDSDADSALVPLNQANPVPLKRMKWDMTPMNGFAFDEKTGAPLPGARIEISMKNREGKWKFVDGFVTDDLGAFGGMVPDLGRELRLTAHLPGRTDPEPQRFRPGKIAALDVIFSGPGKLAFNIEDGEGRGLPARIGLYQGDSLVHTVFSVHGSGEEPVEPGRYGVSVTRGYEYIPYQGDIEIPEGGVGKLSAQLIRAVDTTGFLSTDMHIHAGPSGDNKITIPQRIITCAAEGLEVPVGTDHEAVVQWGPAVEETGLGEWVYAITGEEVTATLPEHINAFPFESRYDIDARGGPVKWQGLNIAEIYRACYDRGAQIVQLNHPRGYLAMIQYNLATGRADLADPSVIGYNAGDSLWSWSFNSIEYQNGNDTVFSNPIDKKDIGMFEYWMSFQNLGHRITGVSNTDAHDYRIPGSPRDYFPAPTSHPAEFKLEYLVNAVREGRILMSTGAFARVQINGAAGMGDTIATDDDSVELWVHVESIPQIDVSLIKVFVNCDETANIPVAPTAEVVKFDGKLKIPVARDSQIVVMGFGESKLPRGLLQYSPKGVPRFTANPIFINVGGDGWTPPGWDGCTYTRP